ncbi:NAD(P)-binding protein [Peniophora sp. CONT]|nr:NAD(P)-binding protein [Peniophora sp. CONT]
MYSFIRRQMLIANPPVADKVESPLRFGLLGTSWIAVTAVINTAKSHPEVVVAAVASRDASRGEAYARKHQIKTVYSGADGYQKLLEDPNIDAIYNALPNSMHFEWTIRALEAGKHVLLEKPCADTAAEARVLFDLADKKGLVLLEGYGYTFYPAVHRVKEIVDSGELGKIKSIHTEFCLPKGVVPKGDIREKYELGGGATMDLGVYTIDALRYITSSNPVEITHASAIRHPGDAQNDRAMTAAYAFPESITADTLADIQEPGWGPFGLIPHMIKNSITIKLEGGEIYHYGLTLPHLFHSIKIRPTRGKERVEKAYTFKDRDLGEFWWTSYRYQLEAFVNRLRGRQPHAWVSAEDSVTQMEWVEETYRKSGLPVRPASSFNFKAESALGA